MDEVIMYQTKDGKIFDDEEKAKHYIENQMCIKLEKFIIDIIKSTPHFKHLDNRSFIYAMVDILAGDYKRNQELVNFLKSIQE